MTIVIYKIGGKCSSELSLSEMALGDAIPYMAGQNERVTVHPRRLERREVDETVKSLEPLG